MLLLCARMQAQLRNYGHDKGLTTGEVAQVIELPNGQILVNTVGDFKIFDGETFVQLPCRADSLHSLPAFGRYGHLWQGDSLLWLCDFHYLYLFDARERRFRYDVDARLRDAVARRLLSGQEGDDPTGCCASWQDTLRKYGVKGDCPVNVVCRDRQQGVWIGTQGQNLFYLPPAGRKARTLPCPGQKAAQVVAHVGGSMLIVGTDDGLWRLDARTGDAQMLKKEKNALYHSAIADRQGRIWFSSQGGIDCYDHGSILHYDSHNTRGFVHDHVYFVRQMPDGRLLVNNDHRVLGLLDVENQCFKPFSKAFSALQRYRVIVDALPLRDGRRILGITQNGAFLLDARTQEMLPLTHLPNGLSDKFNCAWQDGEGKLWMGTQNGLAVMDEDARTSRMVMQGCMRGLAGDAEGLLWVRGSNGLSRIDTRQKDFGENGGMQPRFRLTEADGIPGTGLQERSMVLTHAGMLCLANACGVTLLDTKAFSRPEPQMPVVLTGIRTSRRTLPQNLQLWELAYGEGNLEVFFSALNYAAPEHTHYRYRLKGLCNEWNYTQRGFALFTALPFGHYRFEAQAASLDGEWGPLLEREIIVRRPFWWSAWAMVFYAFSIVLAAAWLAVWYRRRTKAALEAQNDERVNRLFLLREEARHRFAQEVNVTAKEIAANSREEELMGRVMESIERNLGNSGFTVDMLASDACVSRASLYRSIRNMLGITPSDFIRNIRLKQAAQMLEETDFTIAQISERVGFGTPRYFAQQFRKLYGVSPSEYQAGRNERQK